MIREIENIDSGNRVSSEDTRTITDELYRRHSSSYHKLLQIYGLVRTSAVCLEMTNTALVNAVTEMDSTEDNVVLLTPYDTPTYPTSITDGEKAERSQEFMSIYAKRVNTDSVFVDENDYIDSSIEITKSITTEDNSVPTAVVENSTDNILRSDVPYVARYLMDSAVRTTLKVGIKSEDKQMAINAIRFVPMPAVGMVSLDSITYGAGSNIVLNGGEDLEAITSYDFDRTFQGYIHFRPVDTNYIYVSVSSETYLSSLSAVGIGITKIIGEINTYSPTSYIGWPIEFPGAYSRLSRVRILPSKYSNGVENTQVKIYDSLSDFNQVNDNYIALCGANTSVDITHTVVPEPYLLLEITSENGTTPSVGKIQLEFS